MENPQNQIKKFKIRLKNQSGNPPKRKKVNIVFIFDVQLTKRDGPVIRMIYDYITYVPT